MAQKFFVRWQGECIGGKLSMLVFGVVGSDSSRNPVELLLKMTARCLNERYGFSPLTSWAAAVRPSSKTQLNNIKLVSFLNIKWNMECNPIFILNRFMSIKCPYIYYKQPPSVPKKVPRKCGGRESPRVKRRLPLFSWLNLGCTIERS